MYGDATDPDFIHAVPLEGVRWVISAIPQHDVGVTHQDPRMTLLDGLRQRGYAGRIAMATQEPEEIRTLKSAGADLVFLPFQDAAREAVDRIHAGESEAATAK